MSLHAPIVAGRDRRQAGFTLYEILLSGVLAAMLVTALAYATTEFAVGITHLEQKAGVADPEDTALRIITRDIREAWWAEVQSPSHIRLADPAGEISEYFLEDGSLIYRRPDGDEGALLGDLTDIVFQAVTDTRLRDGSPTQLSGAWKARASWPPTGTSRATVGPPSSRVYHTPS